MCTVSIVATEGGFRCIFNRDERLTRSAAYPPLERRLGGCRAIFPVDPEGGGSWIGANDQGLVAMILNLAAGSPSQSPTPRLSRGTIVLGLLEHASLDDASAAVSRMARELFGPFRIVMIHGRRVRTISSVDLRHCTDVMLARPIMFTTSSLGDELVERSRRDLFEGLVRRRNDWLAGQDAFHRHQWRSRTDVSVRMRREDAATVSRTTIEVDRRTIEMSYEDLLAPAQPTRASSSVVLPISTTNDVVAVPC